ncbi:hypothetical protein SEVIR_5G081650v4 [Setaria viridis]
MLNWRPSTVEEVLLEYFTRSGLLTSVATHYPDLDFKAICRGYTGGRSFEEIRVLSQTLAPGARTITAHMTAMWVMEARRSWIAACASQEGATNPDAVVQAGTELGVVPTETNPSVDLTATGEPSSLSATPLTDLAEGEK